MTELRTFLRRHLISLLLLSVAGGFLMLVAELILVNHTNGIQLVAVVASIAGVILALAGLVTRGTLRTIVAVLFVLLAVSGLVGTAEHLEGGEEGAEAVVPAQIESAAQPGAASNVSYSPDTNVTQYRLNQEGEEERERGEREGAEGTPPPLAPLSLSGLALLGALATFAGDDPRESVNR